MAEDRFESWAVVELMGHVRTAGRVTEEERFGCKMGRVDVPKEDSCPSCRGTQKCIGCKGSGLDAASPGVECEHCDGHGDCPACGGDGVICGFTTIYFGGSSVYRLTPCTEQAARAVARKTQPEPVHQWEMPKLKALAGPVLDDEEDGDE